MANISKVKNTFLHSTGTESASVLKPGDVNFFDLFINGTFNTKYSEVSLLNYSGFKYFI